MYQVEGEVLATTKLNDAIEFGPIYSSDGD